MAFAALQTNEQECLDKRLALSYKSTDLPVLHQINVPYQNDMLYIYIYIYTASEGSTWWNLVTVDIPDLCLMFYVKLVPGKFN